MLRESEFKSNENGPLDAGCNRVRPGLNFRMEPPSGTRRLPSGSTAIGGTIGAEGAATAPSFGISKLAINFFASATLLGESRTTIACALEFVAMKLIFSCDRSAVTMDVMS